MRTERFDFTGACGNRLAGRLELPDDEPAAVALFAHCFTCGKDARAAVMVARALAAQGIATLRFDFTGLGGSEGEFANTTFRSNVDDLVAAADALRQVHRAPTLLVGHSLGGAAILAAAERIEETVAVATIGAPFDTAHALRLFKHGLDAVAADGVAEVAIAGRSFYVGRELIRDLASQDQARRIKELRRALLVLHAPTDEVVGIDNASAIFAAARHPKSFVSLDTADHLLTRRQDAEYVSRVLAAWASRYLGARDDDAGAEVADGTVIVEETGAGRFQQRIRVGRHQLFADEPSSAGGLDTGPGPYDLLLASLGACTAMTMRLYAERKGWPLERAAVRLRHAKIHAADCADCETRGDARIDELHKELILGGPIDAEQRARLVEIASRCPVHRTLLSEIKIRTELVDP
jgi:putative redox protein